MGEQARDLLVEHVGFGEIAEADRAAPDLILIGRADAALRRADLDALGHRAFAMRIELAVQRQDQADVFRDLQIVGRDGDALPRELADLVDEMMRIEHHAVADDRQLARPHDARRQQRELVDDAVDDERMAGIVPTLEAHDDIRLARQPIDDLALALVAPLRADDHHIRHCVRSIPARARQAPNTTKPRPTAMVVGAHCGNGLADRGRGVKGW